MTVLSAPRIRRLCCLLLAGLAGGLVAQDAVRTGLEGLIGQSSASLHASERALVEAVRGPLLGAQTCANALQFWFDGRTAEARGDKASAIASWEAGLKALTDLHDLPVPTWPDLGEPCLKPQHAASGPDLYLVDAFAVQWKSDAGSQYGLFMVPSSRPAGHRFPLLTYVHGGLTGLQEREITWLAEQCRKGYAVLAPALRGQPLVDGAAAALAAYRGEGVADDPAGEASDVLAALLGAQGLPVVRPGGGALVGVGRGASSALLVAARSPLPACLAVADADARHLNPFRAYWSRMSRGENIWPGWSAFCSREPAAQLAALRQQSVAHQAAAIRCPVFMLRDEGTADSLASQAHGDVAEALRARGVAVTVETLPGSAPGFSAELTAASGREARRRLLSFTYRYVPSDDGKDALLRPPKPPTPAPGN